MTPSKNILRSKTFWLNLLLAGLPFLLPPVQEAISDHPAVMTGLGAMLNILNRILGTTGPVSVRP